MNYLETTRIPDKKNTILDNISIWINKISSSISSIIWNASDSIKDIFNNTESINDNVETKEAKSINENIESPISRTEEITKLYVATFNRAPDADWLKYWTDSNLSISEISKSFFNSNEAKELYSDSVNTKDFISEIYKNTGDHVTITEHFLNNC